ncbi:MAG TPA: farnesyl diphosphate synthase [Vicinamibacterales bacterium]
MAQPLAEFLEHARQRVDDALERWLPKPPECPAIVADAMRYSVFAGGKRLRPILALAAAQAVDASATDLALPSACAIEMIHTYSLIHDDLPAMDNDTLRRGRPTLHTVYGDGIAILAGDGLHAEAFTLLAREPAVTEISDGAAGMTGIADRKLGVIALVGRAAGAAGMVGGQAVDLQAAGQVSGSRVELDQTGLQAMHARKTGALIRASAASGAIMAGAPGAVVDAIDRYAAEVGLAFQIVDDILDVEGDARSLGKSAGKDALGNKPTYPRLFGLDESRRLAAGCLDRAHEALRGVGLLDTHLPAIAEWVVKRKN